MSRDASSVAREGTLMRPEAPYIRRYVDAFLDTAMEHLPAFMMTGPRGCGKTTTAVQRASSIFALDNPLEAEAFAANPDAALSQASKPVLIDEWQAEPDSLRAVKRQVDQISGPGSFLITGSVRARVKLSPWPGTGRIIPIAMYGLTQGELRGAERAPTFIDRIFEYDFPLGKQSDVPTVREYVEMAAEGGFPSALQQPAPLREHWYEGYVQDLIGRDVEELQDIRRPQVMERLLQTAALHTAGLPNPTALAATVHANRNTVDHYLDLVEELGIIERLPAWSTNRLKRLVKTPKMHFTDTGLALHLANMSAESVMRDPSMLGRIIDSFVASQLRPLYKLGETTVRPAHLRDSNNRREVDLVLESRGGDIAAIEVKATGRVSRKDARHLEWLRDEIGDQFRCGVVFHSGDVAGELADRIWVLPIATIWQS